MDISRRPYLSFAVCLLLIYAILTVLTTVLCGEFTFRHTMFLLAISLLFIIGCKLFVSEKYFFITIALLFYASSAYLIHYLTPDTMRIWEADTFLSFAFSVINYLLFFLAMIPINGLKRLSSFCLMSAIFSPLAYAFGYYLVTGRWIDHAAVLTLLSASPNEAVIFITNRFGLSGFALLAGFFLLLLHLSKIPMPIHFNYYFSSKITTLAMIFFILNGVLLYRSWENFVTIPFLKAQAIIEQQIQQ